MITKHREIKYISFYIKAIEIVILAICLDGGDRILGRRPYISIVADMVGSMETLSSYNKKLQMQSVNVNIKIPIRKAIYPSLYMT